MMIRYEDRAYIEQQLIFDVRQFGQTFWNYDKIPTHSNDYHVGVEYGYQLAIDKAYKWLENVMWYDDIYGLGTNGNENNVAELLMNFKQDLNKRKEV